MSNPFFFGPKITNPAYFVGRQRELKKILGLLDTAHTGQMQHVSVVGERRIGKSSLLYHLSHAAPAYLTDAAAYHFVYVDLQDPHCHTLNGFLSVVLDGLALEHPAALTLTAFYDAVQNAAAEEALPVLLLDEFEKLTERAAEFPDAFYETLRSLGNHSLLGIVTASQHSLKDLARQGKLTSPFFNIFHELPLGVFTEEEADLLLDRAASTGYPFTPRERRGILKIAGTHPARLQIVAALVYDAKVEGTKRNWRAIAREAQREPAFDAHLPAPEKKRWGKRLLAVPSALGHAVLVLIGRGETADPQTDALVGWGLVFIFFALLSGLLPWTLLVKSVRRFAEWFFK